MVFAPECVLEQAVKYSDAAEPKAGNASRRSDKFLSLRNRDDFERIYRRGRRVRSIGVTVLTLEGPSAIPRIGVVAGKKVGNAVSRNRAKRRLREAAFLADLREYTDYILIAGPASTEIAFRDLIEVISERTSGD